MNSKDSLTTGRDDDIQATELNTTQTVGRRGTLRSTISWPAPIPIPKMTKETTHPAGSETISPIGQANANPKEPARANQSRLTPGFLMAIHWNDETTAPIRAPSRTYIQIPGSDSHPLAVAPTIDQPDDYRNQVSDRQLDGRRAETQRRKRGLGSGTEHFSIETPKPESTEGGRLVSILKWPEGALLNLG